MRLETERAAHAGMASHKPLLLYVWCGGLTVAMLVMAALLISIKSQSSQDEVSSLRPCVSPTVNTIAAPLKGSPLSHIQLKRENDSWQTTERCEQCSLDYQGGSIECRKDGLYFLYAQVAFEEPPDRSHHNRKSVILKRNPAQGKSLRKLAEGTFSSKTEGSVWVANVVRLRKGDKISINITGEYLYDTTVWGAYELH